ncbi:hypothetical protein ACROYT_G036494 [Oculina patagonica]
MPFIDKNKPCVRAIHSCSKCHRRFTGKDSKESLIQHLSAEHKIPCVPESCNHCGRSFSDTKALIQHLQNNRHHLKDLHHAACTGKFQLVDQLLRNGFANSPGDSHRPPTSKDQTGYTPMHCAAFGGHDDCLKIMLSWPDGEPNVVDPSDGRTPVHLAAWKGHGKCLTLLLRKGGDLHLRDRGGNTPISLARDPYCLSIIAYRLAGRESQHNIRLSQGIDNSMILVLNSLSGENRSGHAVQFRAVQESCQVEEVSQGSEVACQVSQFQSNSEVPCSEPYEVLARGEMAVQIFNQALREGKACVSRMQLTVIGDVGAGKTSLVRTLSGEEFTEERRETHGIDTSMVEMTELDDSWHAVDLNKSHVDDILADKVCQGIKDYPWGEQSRTIQGKLLSSSDAGPSFLTKQHRPSDIRRLPSIEGPPTSETSDNAGEDTSIIPVPSSRCLSVREETPPRDIPIKQIARRLSKASLNEVEKKYTKISIWDFAGHPLYQAMHHVFLNRRSFYLVVLNLVELCSPESTSRAHALANVDFWLNSIRVHTPQTTPVFLVGTRRSAVSEEEISRAEKILYDELIEKFGQQLVTSKENSFLFAVENSHGGTDAGAVELKKAIEDEASRLMLTDEELPLLWLHFEEEILKYREKPVCPACVRKTFLKDMMERSYRVLEETEFESMLHFYHDSGVIILPEELIGPKTQSPEPHDLVVINPQYLVNVMTCLHDIPKHLDVDREHRKQWETLREEGITDIGLLEHLWKDFDSPAKELVGILEASGLLCPASSLTEVEDPEDGDVQDGSEGPGSEISKYIVPFHLKEKCLEGKWKRLCRKTWTGICNSDKVLMFDFHSFLPPALFHYFIVRTGAKSKSSNGMRPVIAKDMAIFSFGDSYFILAKKCQKYNQIRISGRQVYVSLSDSHLKIC